MMVLEHARVDDGESNMKTRAAVTHLKCPKADRTIAVAARVTPPPPPHTPLIKTSIHAYRDFVRVCSNLLDDELPPHRE